MMLALVVILTVFLVLFLFVVGLIVINLLRSNSDLEKELNESKSDNKVLQDRLDDLQKRPSMIGISYKSDKTDVKKIMDDVANVYKVMQEATCSLSSKTAAEKRTAFIAKLKADPTKTTCADIKTTDNTAIDAYVDDLVAGTGVSSSNASYMKEAIKSLVQTVLDIVCKSASDGNTIDNTKLDTLLEDVFDAICTNV